jgi:hypothetical protein
VSKNNNAKYMVCINYTLKNGKDSFCIAEMARINGEKSRCRDEFQVVNGAWEG